jgi:signal transduction histidine kinase
MRDLASVTAQLSGGEWQRALAQLIHESQLEQDRAGRRLHDETGQNLSSLGLQLGVLASEFQDRAPELAGRIREIQELLDTTMSEVRDISAVLNPSTVDRTGLRFAIEDLIERRASQFAGGLTMEFPQGSPVERPAARALFRVAEPSLDLAASGGATTIHMRVVPAKLGWILEVLYDVPSPPVVDELKANVRLTLLLLQYQSLRAGVEIIFDATPAGGSLLRAAYAGDQSR